MQADTVTLRTTIDSSTMPRCSAPTPAHGRGVRRTTYLAYLQAASTVEPWVPVAANVRDGQVAALYSGLAKCEGGKAVLAAVGLLPSARP
jgi:hypothetical protein